jgi:hypothetical protein
MKYDSWKVSFTHTPEVDPRSFIKDYTYGQQNAIEKFLQKGDFKEALEVIERIKNKV